MLLPMLQGTFELYSDKYFSLAEWIVVAGAAIGVFAVCVPNLHYLRIYSTISCILVFVFTIIVVAISCHDGEQTLTVTVPLFCFVSCLFFWLRIHSGCESV